MAHCESEALEVLDELLHPFDELEDIVSLSRMVQ
jgi:hypothetical protein